VSSAEQRASDAEQRLQAAADTLSGLQLRVRQRAGAELDRREDPRPS
jgi:hypothetical protein